MKTVSACILLSFTVLAAAQEVLVLTSENFDDAIKNNEHILVSFYAPWCGHCKRLEPEFDKAALTLKDETVKLAKVDATQEADLASKFGVRGYPTLKWFRSGSASEYNGPREADGIVNWVRKKSGPATTALRSAGAAAGFAADKLAVVGGFAKRGNAAHAAFVETAKDGDLDDFVFADFEGAEGVTLYTKHAAPQKWDGKGKLKDFVLNNGYPLVDELPEAWARYQKKGHPLAILFVDSSADNKALLAEVSAAAAKVAGKFSFSFADGVRFKQQIERMGGATDTLPVIAAMKLNGKSNYPYAGALTAAALTDWANGIVNGAIKPTLKSEEPPAEQGPVHVAVGKTVNALVTSGKDVLLEIYAPWCGHCKSLAPIYDQLGEHYKDNDNIVIAKIDGTANDIDIEYRGFPTLVWFPAGKGLAGKVDYDGGRTLEDFKKFIEKNSKFAGQAGGDSKTEL